MVSFVAVSLTACVGAGVISAGSLPSVEALLTPFHWKANGKLYSSQANFHNGKELVPGSLNYKGTTYIPIRSAAEALGLAVSWDADSATATLVDSESDEDPVSDVPGKYPNAAFTIETALKADAHLYANTDIKGKPIKSLSKGYQVIVLDEVGEGWLKVVAGPTLGYLPAAVTNYIPSAQRPPWEQKADSIIEAGLAFLGTPYEFNADLGQTATFDCSSYLNYLYEMHGIDMPRNSRQQSGLGIEVSYENLRKGDLVFFTTPKRADYIGVKRIGHVAIYLGGGKILHTYRKGIGVTITAMNSHWEKRMVTARRLITE
jgi:cell wall-associated NlpC family hydrolase